jgi:hypothetical protein
MKLNINGKTVEVSNEELKAALEAEKESLDLTSDALVLRSVEEEETFKDNLRKEGLATGTEIGRKEVIKALGIEGEGLHKSDESAAKAITSWANSLVESKTADLQKEPTAKIKELTKDIELLRSNLENVNNEKTKLSQTLIETKNGYKKQSVLMSSIPDNTVLPKEDIVTILSNKINLSVDDNGNVFGVGNDGQPIKDQNASVIPAKDLINNFFNDNPQYLKGASGGAGGSDSSGAGSKINFDQFTKQMQEKGVALNSEEFNKEMMSAVEAGILDV